MKKIAVMFLLLIGQTVLAQNDPVSVMQRMEKCIGMMDLRLDALKLGVDVSILEELPEICGENMGDQWFVTREIDPIEDSTSFQWLVHSDDRLLYMRPGFQTLSRDNFYLAVDASGIIARLATDNSRFVLRAKLPSGSTSSTAVWNIEGLADLDGEFMAVFD